MSELPSGWVEAPLGDLAEYLNGAAFKPTDWTEEGLPIIRIQNLTDPTKPFNRTTRSVPEELRVQNGDILVSWSATLDAFIWERDEAWLNQHIFRVLPREVLVDKRYLYFLLKQEIANLIQTEHLHGSTMKHINRGPFLSHAVPLPPLSEQRRIAARLDRLFAHTYRVREELSKIPLLVEHYKQAILAAAFRGELTTDWRNENCPERVIGDVSEIDGRNSELPPIPEEWGWTNISNTAQVSGGLTKNATRSQLPLSVPYLRVANVYYNELRLDDIQQIGCTESELERTKLETGDLLVVEGNGSVDQIGRVAIWDGSIVPCSHQNHLIRVRSGTSIIPKYLLYWMLSPLGRQNIERVASSSSGLHTLSISKVSGLPLPICSMQEIEVIIEKIEKAWSWIANLLEEHTQASKLMDRFDKSILAKAFRGELVPQDPNDEPASALLERIRAERAGQANTRRSRRNRNALEEGATA